MFPVQAETKEVGTSIGKGGRWGTAARGVKGRRTLSASSSLLRDGCDVFGPGRGGSNHNPILPYASNPVRSRLAVITPRIESGPA